MNATMIAGIADKVLRQTFQTNFSRFFPVHKHASKTSSSYHTVCFHRRKEKTCRNYTFVNNYSWKTVSHTPVTLCANFQIRHISNETGAPKNNVQLLDVESDLPEEAVDTMMATVPSHLQSISEWKIVELAQQCLLKVHETTGLPWWASIALTALIARTLVTLPFSIITVQNTGKLKKVQEDMNEVVKRLKQEADYACKFRHMDPSLVQREYRKAISKEYKQLVVDANCHPAKNFILVWIQLPLWFSFSFATRNLAYMLPQPDQAAQVTFLEMTVGGFGWVTNLTTPDPYIIFPVLLGLANLTVLEVHRLFRTAPPTNERLDWWITNFLRGISILMIPIASQMPAATIIYWVTSSSFGLMQVFLMQSPKLRRKCGVPLLENEKHPYRQFYSNLKSQL